MRNYFIILIIHQINIYTLKAIQKIKDLRGCD